jgi:hypothetical protein
MKDLRTGQRGNQWMPSAKKYGCTTHALIKLQILSNPKPEGGMQSTADGGDSVAAKGRNQLKEYLREESLTPLWK